LKKDKLEYVGNTVDEVISQFLNDYGDQLHDIWTRKDQSEPPILILLNGRNIKYMKNRHTLLKEGDEISISLPILGG
jgi:molybdopterin converting factor small subunit